MPMMYKAIKNFHTQFAFKPKIENARWFKSRSSIVICGMGGSHVAADLIKIWNPKLDASTWSNYGLPPGSSAELKKKLFVISSYSGNTEEPLDAYAAARKRGLACIAVAVGGKLLALAKKYKTPLIQMPNTGIQPRMAGGFSIRSMLALLGDARGLRESAKLARTLRPDRLEAKGRAFAVRLRGKVPVIYSSLENGPIAYNWKIKFNETGKIP